MGSSFNPQILMDKLSKLNNSQASIETLSHWCIFHMNKAKQVVETWDRQFHSAPREQKLAYLYLANDILQNSRRKGSEFVGEFWRVLPDALRDVIRHGDEFGKNAARRLVNIWEERKVFGSRGQILKEEFLGRQPENGSRNGGQSAIKLKQPVGNTLDKIVSGYKALYGGQRDEEVVVSKCSNAIGHLEKVETEVGDRGDSVVKEVQGQHGVLKDCIEQLRIVEASRTKIVSLLKEALHEEEIKLEQVRNQLQAAQSQSDHADNLCKQLVSDPSSKEAQTEAQAASAPETFIHGEREQSAPVMYTQQVSLPEKSGQPEEDPRKSTAAEVAAKLTASTSSAQMLSHVLSSLASEGIIGNPAEEPSNGHPPEKRPKLENNDNKHPYMPPPNPQIGSFSETQQHSMTSNRTMNPLSSSSSVSLPPLQPPMPVYQLSQYMQAPGAVNNMPCSYNMPMPLVPGYAPTGPPVTMPAPFMGQPGNSFQTFQGSEGFYNQSSSTPMAPSMTRQQKY